MVVIDYLKAPLAWWLKVTLLANQLISQSAKKWIGTAQDSARN